MDPEEDKAPRVPLPATENAPVIPPFDAEDTALVELIMSNVIAKSYDSLFSIDFDADTAKIFLVGGQQLPGPPYLMEHANQSILEYLKQRYAGNDLETFLANNALPAIRERLEREDPYLVDYWHKDDHGNPQLMRGTYSWLDRSRNIACFARTDISDVFAREQERMRELGEAVETAKAADDAKSEFLSHMSHDMRTPLNAIIGLTRFALEDLGDDTRVRNDLEQIESSSRFLLTLVNDVLDMQRIESGHIDLNPEPYAYHEFFDSMKALIIPLCQEKDIQFDFDPGVANYTIIADKTRFNQVFFNIISNAVKFTPAGGRVWYHAECTPLEPNMLSCDFEIGDTGIGISPDFLEHLFQPFAQEDSAYAGASQGTGLGLAIVKKIVDKMGGSIQVNSQQGQGSVFTVHLDLAISPDQYVHTAKVLPLTEQANLEGCRVLLVEDHPLNAHIARRMLEAVGMVVDHAENGRQAVEQFASSPLGTYSVVLMDIRMPEMNGLEATRAIRALKRADASKVPIIAMTANAYDEDVQKSKDAGMNEHLAKPVEQAKLYQLLEQYVRPRTYN